MRTCHAATLLLIIALLLDSQPSSAQTNQHRFGLTGYTVMGRFLSYWQASGGLARFGYPLSDQTSEVSDLNGKSYTVQYFERAEFELHPENQPPYDVLLTQLGRLRYNEKYGDSTPAQHANSNHPLLFPQTGKQTGGVFATYWQAGGGLASFGYPISNEFQEQSELDGKTYTVQYFERAVMELHPENQAPYNVLLTQLGRYRLARDQAQSFRLEPRYGRPFGLRASAHYAVWLEQPPDSRDANTLVAYNIAAQQMTTITTMARDYVDVNGSIVLWEELSGGHCLGCVQALMAKDMDNGKVYTIISGGEMAHSYPTLAGRTVVWIDWGDSSARLMSMNLDEGKVQQISSVDDGDGIFAPLISDHYIVWPNSERQGKSTLVLKLQAFDRSSGAVKQVAELHSPYRPPAYALEGSKLVYTDNGGIELLDLDTNQQTYLGAGDYPSISGDVVVWAANSSQGSSIIRGEKLGVTSATLAISADPLSYPQVAGATLVYQQGDQAIVGISLAAAFNDMGNSIATPTPTPIINTITLPSHPENVVGFKASGATLLTIARPSPTGTPQIYGYDLSAAQAFTNSTVAQHQLDPNDALLAWEENDSGNCLTCTTTIAAFDASSGQRYDVAPGAVTNKFPSTCPTTYRHTVVWSLQTDFEQTAIASRDLDGGPVVQIATITGRALQCPVVSDDYIVWGEWRMGRDLTSTFALRAYDRHTTTIRTLTEFQTRVFNHLAYSLDGDHLVWTDMYGLFYADLAARTKPVNLYNKLAEVPSIKGDYVVFSADGGFGQGCNGCAIWGMKLSGGKARELIPHLGDYYLPGIAAGYLYWEDLTTEQMLYTPIAPLFAASPT